MLTSSSLLTTKGKEESQHKHCPGKNFSQQMLQPCHNKQWGTNRVNRWEGAAGTAQSGISRQHGAERKNSGLGPRWAYVSILAPSLNSCVRGSGRHGQPVTSQVHVRNDARWYLGLCQLITSEWTTPTPLHNLGPCLSAPEERVRSQIPRVGWCLKGKPPPMPERTYCSSSLRTPRPDPSAFR